MPRGFIVETKPDRLEPDGLQAGRALDEGRLAWVAGRFPPIRGHGRTQRVGGEGMQYVGYQQLLVLLFVMQAEFDDRAYLRR